MRRSTKNNHLKKIGLTGGIGSGKSTVAKVFETLGIPVYYADKGAADLMSGQHLVFTLAEHFGQEIMLPGQNQINRKKLADIVFNQPRELQWLNQLIHPLVKEDFIRWISLQNTNIVLMEAAILFEAGFAPLFDQVINVYAPEDLCIRRVMERDGLNREAVKTRMQSQMPPEEKNQRADFVIFNDDAHFITPQVLEVLQMN